MLPVYMAPGEYAQLLAAMREREPARCLEWGSGGGTGRLLADCSFVERYVSVEHHRGWYERVRAEVRDPRLELYWVPPAEPPPRPGLFKRRLRAWDRRAEWEAPLLADYVAFPASLGVRFEFVLVDGRARRFCLRAGWDLLAPGGVLALHDAQRPEYHDALQGLGPVTWLTPWSQGQLALLRKPR